MNFGAFVEILPGKEGLIHISKIAKERIDKVEDVLNVGDEVRVKVIEIVKRDGSFDTFPENGKPEGLRAAKALRVVTFYIYCKGVKRTVPNDTSVI